MRQPNMDIRAIGERRSERESFIDITGRASALLIGQDGQDLLQRLSTNDLSHLMEGGCVQTVLTNEKGRIIDVLCVLKIGAQKLLLVGQSEDPQTLMEWIGKFIIMEDARVEPTTSASAHFVVFDVDPSAEMWQRMRESESWLTYAEDWGRSKLLHFLVDVSKKEELVEQISGAGLRPAGRAEFEEFRIKKAIPRSPNELSDSYNPLEANLGHLVSWTKGCYIGQEVIARLDTYKKVRRRLVSMELKDMPGMLPQALFSGKDEAGTLTSAVRVSEDSSFLGLGYVRTHSLESGEELTFRKSGKEVPAIVSEEWKGTTGEDN
jgi:folate-binding protein YgfZ